MSKLRRKRSRRSQARVRARPRPKEELDWYDVRPFGIEGKGWTDTEHSYDRLPAKARGVVRLPVWDLSHHCAGLCVRFVTDAGRIDARWTLRSASLAMAHMPATGVSGLDLYVKVGRRWRWTGVGQPLQSPSNTFTLVSGMEPGLRQYMLYLPLYNGLESVEIGVAPSAFVGKAPTRRGKASRSICFYGTSATQGGCASRPGMAYPSILGRWLDRPTVNLGFSGNGQAEPEIASLLAELDPCVYVLDPVGNIPTANMVLVRMEAMALTLRASHPDTPIVLVEHVPFQHPRFVTEKRLARTRKNAAMRAVRRKLMSAGVPGIHYVRSDGLMGDDGEAAVDGVHPTDVGFLRIARALEPVLRPLV